MALTYADKVIQELSNLLEEEIERLKDNMSTGSINSLEGYTKVVGIIAGLRMAQDLIGDAISVTNGNR